jgi:hypothetical protein
MTNDAGVDTLGLLEDAMAALEEAQAHNYSPAAALWAAFDHLELANRDQAIMIASVLAMWLSTEMRPSLAMDLAHWVQVSTEYLADRQEAR